MPAAPDIAGPDAVGAALRGILPSGQVLTDAADRDAYAHDDAEWADFARSLAVVLAETNQEVCPATSTTGRPRGSPSSR
jgi:glycolate oxidase